MSATTETASNGAGAASDAAQAFAAALTSAARKGLPEPAPDPRVAAAFALGWQVAVLYRPTPVRALTPAAPDDLLSLGRLSAEQVVKIGLDRVHVSLNRLHDPVHQAGLELPDICAVRTALLATTDAAARTNLIRELHLALVGSLSAVDFRLGKAYGLGRAFADTCRNPNDLERLRAELSESRAALLANWVDDLSSAFPPHAGHSVRRSLLIWRDWVAEAKPEDVDAELLELLRRQGDLWRALLSGEKLGTDMLDLNNYLEAADRAFGRFRGLTMKFLLRFPVLFAVIVLLFVLGVGLLTVPIILGDNSMSAVLAGLGGILASVGLTWRGVGGAVGQLVGSLERPLWGAELDAAITEAITLRPADDDPTGGRRDLARALATS